MIYLLDTHYILWSLFEPQKIKGAVLEVLQNQRTAKMVSGVNLWEISLKYSLGKLDLGNSSPSEVYEKLIEAGYEVAELDSRLLATAYQLPRKTDHRDPFDRLLIWQAISNGYTLITHDRKIEQYHVDGLQTLR